MAEEFQFNYLDTGEGPDLVFQHGLGADLRQVGDLLAGQVGERRLLCMECLNHGETTVTADIAKLSLAAFADDLQAFVDAEAGAGAVIGGLSMGAAITLRLALAQPESFSGLILLRPAWLADPAPDHLQVFLDMAEYLEAYGPWEGKELFRRTNAFVRMLAASPAAAQGVLGQFETAWPIEKAQLLRGIVNSEPLEEVEALGALDLPTLVLASDADPIHPYALAEKMAALIPGAVLRQVPSKYTDEAAHTLAVRSEIAKFLNDLG